MDEVLLLTPFISHLLWTLTLPYYYTATILQTRTRVALYLYNKENIYAYIYTCINVLVQPGGDFYLWHVTLNETRRLPVNILQPNNSVCVFIYVLIDCKTCQIILLCFTGETKCHLYSYVTLCHHLTSHHSMYYLPKPPSSSVPICHVLSHEDGWCCPHCKLKLNCK